MPKAIWNGVVLAQSPQTEMVEGNHYFPPETVNREYLRENETKTVCPWKGTADYYDIVIDGQENRGAAWCYPAAKPAAKNIEGYVAFWRGVQVVD
jgi:uncharacterized protein (DUF427 family)